MSIQEHFGDLDKIDLQYDTDDGTTHLVLCCAGYIDGKPETQGALLDKLEGYLNHIQSDAFRAEYPNQRVVVEITFEEEPAPLMRQLLFKCQPWVTESGAELAIKIGGRLARIVVVDDEPHHAL